MKQLRNCPHCGGDLRDASADGRSRKFRIRVRLYDLHKPNPDDPIADSDEGTPAEEPGSTVVHGLHAVVTEAYEAASSWHNLPLHGLGDEVKESKVRGIRPTLSRYGGRGVMRIPYDTPDSFTDGRQVARYLARVDIQREEKSQ